VFRAADVVPGPLPVCAWDLLAVEIARGVDVLEVEVEVEVLAEVVCVACAEDDVEGAFEGDCWIAECARKAARKFEKNGR